MGCSSLLHFPQARRNRLGDYFPLPAGVSLFFSVGPAALGGAMAVVARRLLPHFEKRKPPERSELPQIDKKKKTRALVGNIEF